MMNAAEELDFYLSMYILLYRERREPLRLNQNFNGYIAHEQATAEQLRDYMLSVTIHPFAAGEDAALCTDPSLRSG